MTKELIEEALERAAIGADVDPIDAARLLNELADALEAATRAPVQGEPNDDRESPRVSMEVIREYRHILAWLEEQSALRAPTGDTMHGLAAEALSVLIEHEYSRHKIPLYGMLDVWQALYETSHPEWDEFYEKHGYAETWARLLDEVRSRATVPDAATERERADLWRSLDWMLWGVGMNDVFREPLADKMIAALSDAEFAQAQDLIRGWDVRRGGPHERNLFVELRAERDAALAAVERVRAAVNGPHPANSGLDSFTLAHISEALDGAPEPEVKP